jgi:hypothetical protein
MINPEMIAYLKFHVNKYGVQCKVHSLYDGRDTINYLTFTFTVKRQNILKYWDKISRELPDTGAIRIEYEKLRFYEHFTEKELEKLRFEQGSYPPKSKYTCNSVYYSDNGVWTGTGWLEEVKGLGDLTEINADEVHSFKSDTRKMYRKNGEYLIREKVKVEIMIPWMFTLNIQEEFVRALELRDKILILRTFYEAEDKLNALSGKPVTPEFEEDNLKKMKTGKGQSYYHSTRSIAW